MMNIFKRKSLPMVYSEKEMEAVEKAISDHFGKSDEIFHEIVSPDIHVDIVSIRPSPQRNFYTLCTMGMGARPMNILREYREYGIDRAEILVTLPPDWKIDSSEEKDYWPLRWLKILARLSITDNTWLGWAHSVPAGQPFADNTRLSGVMLQNPYISPGEFVRSILPGGKSVVFYQMIPLYDEEMNYKLEHGFDALLEKFGKDFSHVVDPERKNYLQSSQ